MKRLILIRWTMLLAGSLLFSHCARAQSLADSQLNAIRFEQKLGAQVSLALPFRDEHGRAVTLREYFGRKPVILDLGYYHCPMLCSLTLNGMIESLEDMRWKIGREFTVISVSIDPAETPALAAAKKRVYLKRYGRGGAAAGWHFLTGAASSSRRLADEVGFRYAYDPAVKQFAHPAGLIVLTPQGRVSKYLFGVNFSPNDFYLALRSAAARRVGSPIRQLFFLCFCYSPIQGKYGVIIMTFVRILGAVAVAGVGWLLISLVRGERRRARVIASGTPAGALAGGNASGQIP